MVANSIMSDSDSQCQQEMRTVELSRPFYCNIILQLLALSILYLYAS